MSMRIGVDLGGTKIEGRAFDNKGQELDRLRVPTPREDYDGTVATIIEVAKSLETRLGQQGTLGVGIPGSVVKSTGLVKNANSTWLNGRPLEKDLSKSWGREVRCANDANCLAVSEAVDGAGAGYNVVFGVILGTGCGGGVAIAGRVHNGPNGIGGEWGHNSLPMQREGEWPGPECYCGQRGCMETWVAGSGLERDFLAVTGKALRGPEIVKLSESGDAEAEAALQRLEDRLARGLSNVCNLLDPDAIVFGGGLSQLDRLYTNVPPLIAQYTFGKGFETPLRKAVHGDASGVRGAAWLWPQE
ncbi:ROK family protein [Terriglobus roseus]|uniref:N-acetylglucosamine kinase n=1 Tax=Terriglobus roseus TaxID=392734 RepID=A0A1G7JRH1_9BACT|nr:ROK family protein [Terriglobus roseus]SDF27513.1 N-acetylglucosamine kinase [Terriglobus roseus]